MEGKRTRFFYFHFRGWRWKIFKMYNVGCQGSVFEFWSKAIYQNWFILEVVSRRFYNVTWCLRTRDFFQRNAACCRICSIPKVLDWYYWRCLIIVLIFAKENPQLYRQLLGLGKSFGPGPKMLPVISFWTPSPLARQWIWINNANYWYLIILLILCSTI